MYSAYSKSRRKLSGEDEYSAYAIIIPTADDYVDFLDTRRKSLTAGKYISSFFHQTRLITHPGIWIYVKECCLYLELNDIKEMYREAVELINNLEENVNEY